MAKHKQGEPKESVSFRIKTASLTAIGEVATEKRWSESQTVDELLEWTVKQLRLAGSFDALVETSISAIKRGRKAS